MIKYIAKPNTWFETGTECMLIDGSEDKDGHFGLFIGIKDGRVDEETCPMDEFEIKDEVYG